MKTKIGITREEFDKSHKEFQSLCPNGQMSKDQFLEKSKDSLGAGPMTGALFRVFDEDERQGFKYSTVNNNKEFTILIIEPSLI